MSVLNQYDDARSHPPPGPRRSFRLQKVTLPGGGFISKGEDGRVAIAGRESLRVLRVADPLASRPTTKIESTRNIWDGSGLKMDCASTDVAWAYGVFNNKILTSARNGELIMWDLAKTGHSKYERKTKEHMRSIHTMSVSRVVHHYCMTGSADGDFRVWDLRDIQSSVMRVHNPSAVRRLVVSPCLWNPLFVLVGMDNGTLHRWDLKMGQRGLLDRLPVAHTAPITTIDWYSGDYEQPAYANPISTPPQQGLGLGSPAAEDYTGNTLGWVATAGLDRCVKVWDLTGPESTTHMSNKPTYVLHPSYPVRRVLWRPGYECELGVVLGVDFTVPSHQVDHLHSGVLSGPQSRVGSSLNLDSMVKGFGSVGDLRITPTKEQKGSLDQNPVLVDAVEIWDVRRSWIAKWSVSGTSVDGGVTDIEFADPYSLLAQNTNGSFTQLDLRECTKPLDATQSTAVSWTPGPGGLVGFVVDDKTEDWEIPYDDIHPARLAGYESTTGTPTKMKRLGDKSFRPKTQKFGVFVSAEACFEEEAFRKLAKEYEVVGSVAKGEGREEVCLRNMQAAMNARKPHIAQIWMLMANSLAKKADPTAQLPTPESPPPRVSSFKDFSRQHTPIPTPTTTHTHTPSSGLASYTFPSPASSSRSPEISFSRSRSRPPRANSGITSSRLGHGRSPSVSQRPTPASSNSSSPLHLTTPLPPITTTATTISMTTSVTNLMTPRRASFLARRESIDSGLGLSGTRRSSTLLRRQSVSGVHHHSQLQHSASPVEKTANASAIKNAGEGVLSDSDSTSSLEVMNTKNSGGGGGGGGESSDGDDIGVGTGKESMAHTPSPLSRIKKESQHQQRHWTEEDDDETYSSPSPGSEDTESEGDETSVVLKKSTSLLLGKQPRRPSIARRGSGKSRSRSSTLASLPAPTTPTPTRANRARVRDVEHDTGGMTAPKLGSQSSTGTVTAVGAAAAAEMGGGAGDDSEIAPKVERLRGNKQQQYDEQILLQQQQQQEQEALVEAEMRITARKPDFVERHESMMLGCCWEILKEAFEELVVEGDVQTAAMIAVIAPKELGVSVARRLRIFDAYIDQLFRHHLYASAAYFRKHSQMQQIKNMTLLETTIFTTCGRCNKPLNRPIGRSLDKPRKRLTFNFCASCRSPAVMCTICRLPVQNMLFQCSICHHGGHQSCYREFYLGQAMVDVPSVSSDQQRGRSYVRLAGSSSPVGTQIGDLAGHPCAAGCGHFCWAALKG